MSSSSESHGTHDLNVPIATAPQGELVERLQTDASYLGIKSGSYPVIAKDCAEAAALIQSQAAEIERLTRENGAFETGLIEFHRELSAAEADLAKAREALTPSADTKAAYIGEFSFGVTLRAGNQEDYRRIEVPWTAIKEIMAAIKARAALPNTTGEAE